MTRRTTTLWTIKFILEMAPSSLFPTILSHDWDGTFGDAAFVFLAEFKGLGLDSFYPSCYIPRLYTQTLRWSILNIHYPRTSVFAADFKDQIAVICHKLVDHESTHVSVCFSERMNPSSDRVQHTLHKHSGKDMQHCLRRCLTCRRWYSWREGLL